MKWATICVCVFALAASGMAQTPANELKAPAKASLRGSVVKEPSGEPLKKAIIELIGENQEESGNFTATSDQDGHFKIMDILPGRYLMFAERTGYLAVDAKRRRSGGISLSFEAGQELRDQILHMLPASVILGRVLDEDGDPISNVEVAVLRRRGPGLLESGSAQTDDLGEYRVGGLLAGKYLVRATPTANFQSMVPIQKTGDEAALPSPDLSYVTTFYPGTADRAQAASIEVHAGEETPVDFSLSRKHTARIRGSVRGISSGSKAAVILRSKDAQSMFGGGEVDKNGKFEILHVAPGSYTITAVSAFADSPMIARQSLEVGEANIDDLRLIPQAGGTLRGRVHLSGKLASLGTPGLMVYFRQIDDEDPYDGVMFSGDDALRTPSFAKIKPDGSFEVRNVPQGVYDLSVSGDSKMMNEAFTESIVVGTKDFADTGLTVSGGTLSVELTVSDGAGVVDGTVTNDKGVPLANASVVAVPETRFRKRPDRYQHASSDQDGRFTLRGLRPGTYSLFAWEVLDGDAYFDVEFLKTAEGHETVIKIEKSSHQTVPLKVLATPADQP
jgi:hypothetical protein